MSGNTRTLITSVPQPSQAAAENLSRFSPALIVVFPILGAILAVSGMPLIDIVPLLASCAGIGLLTAAVFYGGKRVAALFSSALRNHQ
ncbi:hypothetical protein [Streptomyces sp. NPDC058583]|uniref:hypothetical protein n=1 Tax=unclassified Streptomyces TaxID=2593676 RepID=UPI003653B52A